MQENLPSHENIQCFKIIHLFFDGDVGHLDPDPDPADQNQCGTIGSGSTILIRTGYVVPEGADGHVGALRYEDHLPCRGPPHHSPVDRPQAGQDPEQGGLTASVRTGYEHMLTRLHLLCNIVNLQQNFNFNK